MDVDIPVDRTSRRHFKQSTLNHNPAKPCINSRIRLIKCGECEESFDSSATDSTASPSIENALPD
jgi:hypothetical protein